MDITSCLSEWYNLTDCITPKSTREEVRMRILKHCYFDPDRLVGQVDNLTRIYKTGDRLFEKKPGSVRTRHVFVAALRTDVKEYKLFRSYPIPAKPKEKLREGPRNPEKFKISDAFGVTGAAKFFSPPWKENMASGAKMRFSDTKFPKPHNITELALDEMWGLYGKDVALSVIVNIGPGLPTKLDIKQIARRFSWGLKSSRRSSASTMTEGDPVPKRSPLEPVHENIPTRTEGPSIKIQETKVDRVPAAEKTPIPRIDTFGSIKGRKMEVKLRRLETDIERDIKTKLDNIYPEGINGEKASQLYYRLALDQAPEGTAQNDSSAAGAALDATLVFLKRPFVETTIFDIAQRV